MEKPLLLIKLGGSIITDKTKPYHAREDQIRRIARILKKVNQPLLLSHGSGSFGHTSAAKYGGSKGYSQKEGIAKVSQDALAINAIVMKCLVEEGLPAVSVRPASSMIADQGELAQHFFRPVELLLSQGLIPVLYGDVIWDLTWKSTIFSGETTLGYLAQCFMRKGMRIKEIVELCDTNGILDQEGKTIPDLTPQRWTAIEKLLFTTKTTDVTGGMHHKAEEAFNLVKRGVATRIIDGNNLVAIENVLIHNMSEGTFIHQ